MAVDPGSGAVGTRTRYSFHSSLAKLAARCHAHLAGATDLFPAATAAPSHKPIQVPKGEANLGFGSKA